MKNKRRRNKKISKEEEGGVRRVGKKNE